MIKLETLLVVTSPSMQSPSNSKVLMLKDSDMFRLPSAELTVDKSSVQVAAELLLGITGIRARLGGVGWVDLIPMPLADSVERIMDGERVIGIPYGAMLPGEICELKSANACWLTLSEVWSSEIFLDHKEIIQAVCLRI